MYTDINACGGLKPTVELQWANYAYRYIPEQDFVNISIKRHQGSKGDVRRWVGEKSVRTC
jgi:hypothetical protein